MNLPIDVWGCYSHHDDQRHHRRQDTGQQSGQVRGAEFQSVGALGATWPIGDKDVPPSLD
jgi:hypothetical protein